MTKLTKKEKRNLIVGTVIWVLYGLIIMGLMVLLDYVFIYSGLFTYWKRTAVEAIMAIVIMCIGYLGYISKVTKGYFIRKGLI